MTGPYTRSSCSIFYLFMDIVCLSGLAHMAMAGNNDRVQSFDPASLYAHFKASTAQEAHMAGADSAIGYITPRSQQFINNGSISRSTINQDFNRFSYNEKRQMKWAQENMGDCWNALRDEANGLLDTDVACYLMDSLTTASFNPAAGLRTAIYDTVQRFVGASGCPSGYRERIQAGLANVKFLQCLTQKSEDLEDVMGQHSTGAGWGLHVELGFGGSVGYYYQASNGVAWNFQKSGAITATKTTCHGVKLDLSAGVGISVSFLPNMDDLLGAAMTIELGVDLIGEAGFDVLLHYAYDDDGFPNKFVGFGFAFGIGVGIMPVDVAVSYCNTELIVKFDGRSNGYALLNIEGLDDGSSLTCDENLLGVHAIVKGKTCCPHHGVCPDQSDYCWVDGSSCPRKPSNIVTSTGVQLRGKYTLEWIFKRAFCPNVQQLQIHHPSYQRCKHGFDHNVSRGKGTKYMLWKEDVKECWFSDTFSLDSCVWAPSKVSQISFNMIENGPKRTGDDTGVNNTNGAYRYKGRGSGRGGSPRKGEPGGPGGGGGEFAK